MDRTHRLTPTELAATLRANAELAAAVEAEALALCRPPRWFWLAAAAVIAGVIVASAVWPWGFAA